MVGIVIGASIESIYAITCAQKMGVYVVALDGNSEAPGLKIADKSIVVDIRNKELVCDTLEEINPTLTIPVPIGRYLTTTGYVNEHFKLKGINNVATELCTDKYLFHKKLNTQGLRQINSYLIKNKHDYVNKKFHYPVIIKPRFGSGSRGVVLVNNENELAMHLESQDILEEDLIIEDAVAGTEYGIDGAVVDGVVQLTLLRKKIITPPPARQCVGYFSVNTSQHNHKLYEKIKKFLDLIISELEMDNCLFHADLIINEDNIFIIEISGRPSGHYLHNIFTPYATDIDMISEHIKFIKNGTANFEPQEVKTAAIHYFNFENCIVNHVPSLDEFKLESGCNIVDYICNIAEGEELEPVNSGRSIMQRGYFIVRGEDEENLICQINKILSRFKLSK